MTIKRDDLGKTGFRNVATGRRLAPVHPGSVLMREFIEPLGITRCMVAKLAGKQQPCIDEICAGTRARGHRGYGVAPWAIVRNRGADVDESTGAVRSGERGYSEPRAY